LHSLITFKELALPADSAENQTRHPKGRRVFYFFLAAKLCREKFSARARSVFFFENARQRKTKKYFRARKLRRAREIFFSRENIFREQKIFSREKKKLSTQFAQKNFTRASACPIIVFV
jgi:hypothetical protein